MKYASASVWAVRVSWAMAGGAWGAWVGFRGYLRLPNNADSFGSMAAAGFFGMFALVGLLLGSASAALIGGLVERALRRSGAGAVGALGVASLVNAVLLWLLAAWVQARFPGL